MSVQLTLSLVFHNHKMLLPNLAGATQDINFVSPPSPSNAHAHPSRAGSRILKEGEPRP